MANKAKKASAEAGETTSGTKRTLDELITLYDLEPELSEIITEGRTDAALIRWFLNRVDSDTAVFCVTDRLDTPAAEVSGRGLNIGNRGYVIANALMLQERTSGPTSRRVTFVYDIDDDVISGRSAPRADCLVSTDYTSMEMYCFAVKPIDKLLRLTLRAQDDINAESVLMAVSEPLTQVFYARSILARQQRPIGVSDAIDRKCRLSGEVVEIDTRALVESSISSAGGANALGVDVDSILSDLYQELASCPAEIRLAIRGHDFTRVCCFYLKTRYPSLFKEDRLPYKTPQVFENILITCLEVDDLVGEPLFQFLIKRYKISWPRGEQAA